MTAKTMNLNRGWTIKHVTEKKQKGMLKLPLMCPTSTAKYDSITSIALSPIICLDCVFCKFFYSKFQNTGCAAIMASLWKAGSREWLQFYL